MYCVVVIGIDAKIFLFTMCLHGHRRFRSLFEAPQVGGVVVK